MKIQLGDTAESQKYLVGARLGKKTEVLGVIETENGDIGALVKNASRLEYLLVDGALKIKLDGRRVAGFIKRQKKESSQPLKRLNLEVPIELYEQIQQVGGGNVSQGLRQILDAFLSMSKMRSIK